MRISVAGKNMDVGVSLQTYIEEKITKTSDNYLKNVIWVDVVLSKHGRIFHVDVVIHDGEGVGTMKASNENDEVYSAFDGAILRVEKQLRRHKHRILTKQKKNNIDKRVVHQGMKYVISSAIFDNVEEENDVPLTIAEKVADIETLTVSDAIMQMDLKHLPALLFKNEASGRLNIVYYRADGNISWVDPGSSL